MQSNAIEEIIIHTGQHYDNNMSKCFFEEFNIPEPSFNLGIGSGSHAYQTGKMMQLLEEVISKIDPDWVLTYGDTNSTLAGGLVAVKLQIPVIHIEAGLRGYNLNVPEEVNRKLVDHISTLLFCPSALSVKNLEKENIINNVYNVGDVMYDLLLLVKKRQFKNSILKKIGLKKKDFYLATIHRAENTDSPNKLGDIINTLSSLDRQVVIPLHPRTKKYISQYEIKDSGILFIEPTSYQEMIELEESAKIVITVSGGMQKEAYWLKTPCITMEEDIVWEETFDCGCNRLAGSDSLLIKDSVKYFCDNYDNLNFSQRFYGSGNACKLITNHILRLSKGQYI